MNAYQIQHLRRQIAHNQTLQAVCSVVMFILGMVILGAIFLFNQ